MERSSALLLIFGALTLCAVALSGCTSAPQAAPLSPEEQAARKARFAAQVVAVQWVGPVVWRDYPTQWNLYRLMGLAEPNPDDKEAKTDPDYQGIKAIRAIASNSSGKASFDGYIESHLSEMLLPHRIPYFTVKDGFYSDAKGSNRPKWTDARVEFVGPNRQVLRSDDQGFPSLMTNELVS